MGLKSFLKAPKLGAMVGLPAIDHAFTRARQQAVPIVAPVVVGSVVTTVTQNPALGAVAATVTNASFRPKQ